MTNNPTQVEPVEGLADELKRLIDQEASAPTFAQREVAQMNLSSWLVSKRAHILSALRSSTVNDELVAMLVADPVDVSAGIPEHLIEVGMDVLDRVDEDNRNYIAGETTDWDTGMAAAAVFKAMLRAALTKIGGESNA